MCPLSPKKEIQCNIKFFLLTISNMALNIMAYFIRENDEILTNLIQRKFE